MAVAQHQVDRVVKFFGGASGGVKFKKAHIASPVDTTETLTGITMPAKCLILDVFIDVLTVDAGETLLVGNEDDPNGFGNLLSLAATGIIRGQALLTAGGNETYFVSNTRGALLSRFAAGSNVATDVGTYQEFPNTTSGGQTISYSTSAGTDTAVFDVYVTYLEL